MRQSRKRAEGADSGYDLHVTTLELCYLLHNAVVTDSFEMIGSSNRVDARRRMRQSGCLLDA